MIVVVLVGLDLTGAVSLRIAPEKEDHREVRHRLGAASYWLPALRPPFRFRNGAIIQPPAAIGFAVTLQRSFCPHWTGGAAAEPEPQPLDTPDV